MRDEESVCVSSSRSGLHLSVLILHPLLEAAFLSRNKFWENKRVFVTGCTGIVGSWLTLALLDAGAEVVGLIRDRVPSSNLMLSGAARRIAGIDGDITDAPLLERVLNEYE